MRGVVFDFGSDKTGTTCLAVLGVSGIFMVLSAGEVSFFAECPNTTWLPLGPVKTVPAGLLWADGIERLETAELGAVGPQVHAPGSVDCVPPGAAAAIEPTTATARINEATNSVRDGRQRRLPEGDCLRLPIFFPLVVSVLGRARRSERPVLSSAVAFVLGPFFWRAVARRSLLITLGSLGGYAGRVLGLAVRDPPTRLPLAFPKRNRHRPPAR